MTVDVAGTGQSTVPSRFIIQEAPVALPGSCGLCGKHEHEKGFIYTTLDFEFYGNLIFCYDCFCDMARQFGLISTEDAKSLETQRDNYKLQNIELSAQVANLREAVDALRRVNSVSDSVGFDPTGNPVLSDDSTSTGADGETGSINPGLDEQINVEGPDDISGIAERYGIDGL